MELSASARRLTMYKYIAFCLCVTLCGVVSDLNLEEGSPCEWDGVEGQCVKETRCLSTLDPREEHPVCSTKFNVKIVCCTDCQLVNDTRNVVLAPDGLFFKDGTKARDSCLEYLKTLPHKCREAGYCSSGIGMNYDEKLKCHSLGKSEIREYPHQAMLGKNLSDADWKAGGTILSDRYILTAASCGFVQGIYPPTIVALDVKKRSDHQSSWQTHKVKRFIPHPDYQYPNVYHDIALIQTETLITFNKNVLPACLHVVEVNTERAKATTWNDLKFTKYTANAETLQTIHLEKFTDEECITSYTNLSGLSKFKNGIDPDTQMCYGSRTQAPEACLSLAGEPLLVSNQFSRCIYTVIGVTSTGRICEDGRPSTPDLFTRVAYYKSWIESIVWT